MSTAMSTKAATTTPEPLSWKPVLRGPVYCAPACGGKCTAAQHAEATQRAAIVAARLHAKLGSAWVPRVWENLGWHCEVTSPDGSVKVWINHDPRGEFKTQYQAEIKRPGTPQFLSARRDTPEAAVRLVFDDLRQYQSEIRKLFEDTVQQLPEKERDRPCPKSRSRDL